MQLGMIGLGRMGANMVRRLMAGGHDCVVYDMDGGAVDALASEGAVGAESLADLASKLDAPRAVWVMVPAGDATESTVLALADELEQGGPDHLLEMLREKNGDGTNCVGV